MNLTDILKQLLLEEKKKADRCKRIADHKFDKPSAYKSGAIVRCRQGKIWKDLKEEEIIESKQVGILYHWTKLKNLKNIIKTNTLNVSHAGHGIFDYVSTTRSKDKFQFGIAESSDVAIVLDGDKISNRYKIIPYHDVETEEYDDVTYRDEYGNQIGEPADDWKGEGIPKIKRYGAFDEMEELIVGPLYPLDKYIIKIILYKTNPEIESLLKEKNIPYEVKLNEDESLHKWFKRKGAPGKTGGWVDCNTCRDGKCKPCGRQGGEQRSKYPRCRPTPSQCKEIGRAHV